jgi:hypothetical protein
MVWTRNVDVCEGQEDVSIENRKLSQEPEPRQKRRYNRERMGEVNSVYSFCGSLKLKEGVNAKYTVGVVSNDLIIKRNEKKT